LDLLHPACKNLSFSGVLNYSIFNAPSEKQGTQKFRRISKNLKRHKRGEGYLHAELKTVLCIKSETEKAVYQIIESISVFVLANFN
jgi:hypothetical protein